MPTLEEFLTRSDGVSEQSSTPATDFPSATLSLEDFTKPPVEGMPVTYSPEFVLPEIPKYPQNWKDSEEKDFKEWYKGWAEEAGIDPNPDDPRHHYDYRSAYRAGAFPTPQDDGKLHWPSQFKHPDHPNRYVNGVDTTTGKPDPALMSSVGSIADAIANKAKALARGAGAGVTTGLGEMGGQVTAFLGHQFARLAPSYGEALEKAGNDITTYMEEKEKEWFAPDEGTAVDRMFYQAAKMLGPSVIPAGAARAGLGLVFGIGKKLAEADKLFAAGNWLKGIAAKAAADEAAARATKFASVVGATFFGLAQAGDTQQRGLQKAAELEAQGKFDEAKKVRDMANGLAPLGTGVIEAIGEYLGTKYLAKFFKLDEAEAFKRGGKQLVKDFLKTLGVEVATEMGQGGGEAAVEVAAGISPPKSKSELLSMFGNETPIDTALAAALDAIGPTAIMTLITGGFGAAVNLGRKSEKDLLKEAADTAGVPEEDVLPKPDSILKTMGALPPAGEGAAATAAATEPVEPTIVFGSMAEAEEAGVTADPEQVVAWTNAREQANQDAKFFLATGQRAKANQSNLQAARIARALEAAKNPDQFGAEKKEEKEGPIISDEEGGEKLKLEPITLGGEQTHYGVNPSTNQITGLMKKSREGYLRGMLDKNGDFYVWDAYHATHSDFMHLLNLNTPDFGGMFETYFLIADKADQKRAGQDIPEWEGNVSTPEEAYQTAQRRRKEIEDVNEYDERMEKEAEEGKERMTPSAAVRAILGDEGENLKLEKPYSKAPDNLMGFAKEGGKQKTYDEQNYKYELPVKVTGKGGFDHYDVIKGVNKAHALERARRNWEGENVEETTFDEVNKHLLPGEAKVVPAYAKPITPPKRVMDMHGAIAEEEESTGQAFDFRNKRDRAWLASLGYSERDIDSAERWARKAWKPGQPTKLREPAEAIAKEKAQPISPKVLDNKVTSEGGYAYHATNSDRLQDIAATGELKTNKPNAYTDQNAWPDGSVEKRSYFSNDAGTVWQFAPEDGTPVLVRTKSEGLKTESTGDRYSTKPIKAADLEYLGQDNKWHPVVELATPTAKFAGWQEVPNKEPMALYHIVGGPSDKSTVSAQKLEELGIEVPETPAVPKKEVSKPKASEKAPSGKTNIEVAEEGENLKLEEVTVEPLYKGYGVTRDVQILTNPATSVLQGFVARSNSGLVRAFITRDGEFIVWDAHDAIHAEMAEALGLRANDVRNEFYIKDRTVFGQSDLAQDYDVFSPESAVKYWRNFVDSGEKLKLERLPIFSGMTVYGGSGNYVPTLINPTTTAVTGFLKKSQGGVLRGIMTTDGDLYVWDAYDAIHGDFMRYLSEDKVVSYWVVGETVNGEQLRREVPEWFDSVTGMPLPGVVTPKGLMDAHYATKHDLDVLLLGGEGGIGAPISMLRIAQELEKKFPGDRKLVWKKTGWVRGPGGKWRFEIDDSKAKIKNPGKGTMQKVTAEDIGWRWRATRPQLIDRKTRALNIPAMTWKSSVKLSDILDHPELFQRYPQLRDITIVVDPNIDHGGWWDPAIRTIGISDSQFLKAQDLVDTLFHEIQHAIQTIEGFPAGTSVRLEYDRLKNDPRNANVPEDILWQRAFAAYEMNAGENESIDTQARLTMTAKKKANVPPYDRAEELVGATTSAWIVRQPDQSTSFQIDTNRAITKSMLDFYRGANVMGEVSNWIREAMKMAGFDKFPELMARIDFVLSPYVKIEKLSKKTVEDYMAKYSLTEQQVLEMVEQNKVRGSQRLVDPVHSLIKLSYLLNQTEEQWKETSLHEMWHVVEDFFFTDAERADVSKFIPREEDRADAFAKYVLKVTQREQMNSTLVNVFNRIIWFLKELRAKLFGANIRSAEELFDYVRRGKLRPKLLENTLKYQKLTGITLTRGQMRELIELRDKPPENWVDVPLTEDANPEPIPDAKKVIKKLVVDWMQPEVDTDVPLMRRKESSRAQGFYKQSRKEFQGTFEETMTEAEMQDYWKRGRLWNGDVERALSEGLISLDTAKSRGYHALGGEKWQPLPKKLYHATVSKSRIVAEGLKSREELARNHVGLGGGPENTISLTESKEVGKDIVRAFLEAKAVLNKKISIQKLLDDAYLGTNTRGKGWLTKLMQYFDPKWERGDDYPYAVRELLEGKKYTYGGWPRAPEERPGETPVRGPNGPYIGGHGKELYFLFTRPLTEEEWRERALSFYGTWSWFREYEGGPVYPLFFGANAETIAHADTRDIRLLEVEPIEGAQGYPVGSLGEWRTASGAALDVVFGESKMLLSDYDATENYAANIDSDERLSLDTSGWTPPKNEAQVGDEDRSIPKILEMPEILRIYKSLMGGKLPGVRKLLFGKPGIRGVFIPGKGTVRLKAENFRDPNLAARILSHEIGHIIDWLPNFMIQGNILGKISGLKTWLINTLPFKPGAPGPLTEEDKKRLREEAIKLLGVKQELRTKWIDTSLYEDIKISPEDVLKIWNAVENARLLNPELYKYIAGLDTNAKKLIIKAALKGNLTPELEKFVKSVRVGPATKQQVTEMVYKQPTQEEILKKLAELIEKEIRTRQLWVEEEVRDELMTLSARWRPWDPSMGTPWYNQIYRPSAEELYADAISALFNDPQFLKAQAPRFYEAFFNYLDAKKDFKKIYLEIQREIHSGEYRQNRRKALYEMWDHGNEVYGQQYEKEKIPFKDDALRAAFDAFHFILKDVRKVGEENIPDQFNPRFKLEEMVYTPSEIEGMLTVLYRNVIKPLEKAGLQWDREFGTIIYLMRVAFDKTIQGQAHPGGWDKQMAIEELNYMKEHELNPAQWAALKEAAKAFRKIHEEFFIDKAEDAEVYDKDMIKRFRDNDTYATWDIMPYLEARYGRAVATRVFKPIGSLQDIPNPATATIMKDVAFIKAVNHNIAVKTVVKFYQDYANILGVDMKEAPVVWRNGRREIEEPDRDSPYGLVVYLHKGEAKGVWLPKDIAESLHTNPIKYTFLARVLRGLTNPMRQIFTNLNYGFWIVNAFFRDAQRLVMALPGWNVGKFAKHWMGGIRPAFRSTFAIPDDVVLEMQKNNMLISVTDMHDLTDEDTQIERLLRLYAVKGPAHYSNKVLKPWGHLMNYVTNRLKLAQFYFEATGRALERTTKIGAYTYLTENFPDMSKEMIGHIVRTRGGSPDFWRAGREQSLLNNLLMFFNAQKEGYRGDLEAYKDNPGEYLSKKLVFTVLPKLLMYAGFLGLLGAAVKDIFDGVSEYDLTNYFIVPLGRTSTGRVVYWRIPLDEFSRLVGGVLWKSLRTIPIPSTSGRDESVALGEGITHLMDYAAGQVPTVSPLIGVLMDVVEYASGINPYDTFYGRHAMGDVEFQAKDSRAREQFLKYVIEKMGGNIVYKFKHDKVEKIAEELESILGFPVHSQVADLMLKAPDQPVVSNILGRFLKVSNFGEREKLLKLKDKVKTENARVILDAREAAYALVDGKQLTNEQVLAMAQKPDVLNRQMMLSLARKYGMVYFEEWLSAGTTKEKWAVLSRMMEKNALKRQDANVSAPPSPGALPSASSTTNSQYPPLSVEKETNK